MEGRSSDFGIDNPVPVEEVTTSESKGETWAEPKTGLVTWTLENLWKGTFQGPGELGWLEVCRSRRGVWTT